MKKLLVNLISVTAVLILLASCGAGDTGTNSDDSSSSKFNSSKSTVSYNTSSKNAGSVSSAEDTFSDTLPVLADGHYDGTRDPFYWPFADNSIWNMPIGSDAKFEKANFTSAYCMSIDDEYIVKVPEGSPYVDIYAPSAWNQRWPGTGGSLGKMQIPANFYLADAQGNSTPNNCAAFIMPDGKTIKQLEPCCRTNTEDLRIVGYPFKDIDIYGDGIGGTHYGSGLSAIGGSIRKGELISNEPIRHAIKLNVYAKKYLYYDHSASKGYIWPADRNDSYAASGNNAYGGSNPKLRMGTLLAIPKDVTAQSLGITTEVGKRLFYALQNYGCYIADDSAWDCYAWSAEKGVCDEVTAKYGISLNTNSNNNDLYYRDSQKLISALYIVTNNSPDSIGGGGTPCKPLAPAFK